MICIYVAIGQKASTVAQVYERLKEEGAMEYTIIVTAPAPRGRADQVDGAVRRLRDGRVLHVQGRARARMYDDLSKHADAYRQMSLLLRRPPGREAFPGDVFYLHSRLLERACKLSDEQGGGSLTALPIIETQAGDVVGVHPDERDLDHRRPDLPRVRPLLLGRPAGDQRRHLGLARRRLGAQIKAMKKVAGRLRLDLAQYRELEAFAQFGSELDQATQKTLARGERMVATLNQPQYAPWPMEEQVVALYAGINGYLDEIPVADVPRFQEELREHLRADETILKEIRETRRPAGRARRAADAGSSRGSRNGFKPSEEEPAAA